MQAVATNDDLREIYNNLFYEVDIGDELDGSPKQRFAFLRVWNALERHFIQSKIGFVGQNIVSPVLDNMLKEMIANDNFYKAFQFSHYTKEFVDYVEEVRRSIEPGES